MSFNYIKTGARIWCHNPKLDAKGSIDQNIYPYILCQVTYVDTNAKFLEAKGIEGKIPFQKTMPFINGEDINIPDMAAATDICEVDLLNNLCNRLVKNKITFTNVGPTLLIVNPYKRDDSIYTNQMIEHFISLHKTEPISTRKQCNEPHLYDIVLGCIERLIHNSSNQAIVISGESGAGKTEAAKNCMQCIVYYFQGRTNIERRSVMLELDNKRKDNEPLEKKILSCNPILESFGNAKTVRNDNSSRFGKYVTINIDIKKKKILGANIKTYLLEKIRVVQPAKNERSFHIFYQLLNSGDSQLLKRLYLTKNPEEYNYLQASDCYKVNSIDDKKLFNETVDCFRITGFSDEEIENIFKILAAILLMGNLNFQPEKDGTKIENWDLVEKIADLLCSKPEFVAKAFTTYTKIIAGVTYQNDVNYEDAKIYCDSFAKDLYNRLFQWIIVKLNSHLDPYFSKPDDVNKNQNIKYIGLLDIFGFECFDHNTLEQLCINYTNEQLQHLYIKDFFMSEIEEFKKDGLGDKANLITYKDNQGVIDLIDLPPTGIFLILNDCSLHINDKDKNINDVFINKAKKDLAKNKNIILPRIAKNYIIKIKHSAKEVAYDCVGFVNKNVDELKLAMLKIINESTNDIIKIIFYNVLSPEEVKKLLENPENNKANKGNANKYLTAKFRLDMHGLMNELKSCECSYIRCLKPNEEKREFFVTPLFLFNQIQYLGIFDTIKVRKDGYPSRKTYEDFINDFSIIFPELKKDSDTPQNQVVKVINNLIPDFESIQKNSKNELYLLGTGKIYMKQEFNILLENKKEEYLKKKIDSCNIIVTTSYYLKNKEKLNEIKQSIENIQNFYNVNKFKILKISKIQKIKEIQATILTNIQNNSIESLSKKFIPIQTLFRMILAKQEQEIHRKQLKFLSVNLCVYLYSINKNRVKKFTKIAKYLVQKSVDNVIRVQYNNLFKKLHPYFLLLLTRIKYSNIAYISKLAKENYSKNFVFQLFQSKLFQYKINKQKLATKKIRQFAVTVLSSRYTFKMRENVLTIQKYLSRYINQEKAFRHKINQYFKIENKDKKMMENKLEEDVFPMLKILNLLRFSDPILFDTFIKYGNINNKDKVKYKYMRNQLKEENSKINYTKSQNSAYNCLSQPMDAPNINKDSYKILNVCSSSGIFKLNNINIMDSLAKTHAELLDEALLPEFDEFKDQKINFFARILSIDPIVNINEIYQSDWGEEFKTIYNKNMRNGTPIQTIVLGDTNTLMLNSLGRLFSFGWNEFSQCGTDSKTSMKSYILPKENTSALPSIFYQENKNISQIFDISANSIFCGRDSTFLVTNRGDAIVFGNNNNGQLGVGNPFPVEGPGIMRNLKGNVKYIKGTKDITLALTKENDIYLWFSKGEKFIKNNNEENNTNTLDMLNIKFNDGIPYKVYFLNQKVKISMISCGYNFTMLLSKTGIVYGLGSNVNGELGLTTELGEQSNIYGSKNSYYYAPYENKILSEYYKEKIINIKCGFKHTICLSSGGKIFVWGNNKFGQLGLGNFENVIVPVNVDIDKSFSKDKIIQIQCGFRSSIFLTGKRQIFFTGYLDKENQSKFPKKFDLKMKSQEIADENKFSIVRLMSTWTKNFSIFYVTVADVRSMNYRIKNINKINKVLDILAKNWKDENIECPYIESVSNYFPATFMKKFN